MAERRDLRVTWEGGTPVSHRGAGCHDAKWLFFFFCNWKLSRAGRQPGPAPAGSWGVSQPQLTPDSRAVGGGLGPRQAAPLSPAAPPKARAAPVESAASPGPGSAAPLAPFLFPPPLPSRTQTSTWAGQRVPAGAQLTASWLAESNVGWGGAWPPASLAIGPRGTRLSLRWGGPAGAGACRARRGRAPSPPLSSPSPSPRRAARPSAPPPLPAPCRCLSVSVHRSLLVWGDARTVLAAVAGSVWPGPDKRARGPSARGARAGAPSERSLQLPPPRRPGVGEGWRGRLAFAPRLWTCPFLCACGPSQRLGRSEARGPPAGKAPRGTDSPWRAPAARTRRKSKPGPPRSRGLAFFFFLSPLPFRPVFSPPPPPPRRPKPSLARRAPPRSTSPSWRGGWESRAPRSAGLGSPPRTPAPRRRSPACPARRAGRAGLGPRAAPRFRAFSRPCPPR